MTARVISFLLLLSLASSGQQDVRFVALDVYVDTGDTPLAAYQIEIVTKALIVGVEGGEPAFYSEPPYYDPRALRGGRIILAAFTTAVKPPAGKLRVARVHLQDTGKSDYKTRLMTAATPGGERIPVTITLVPVGDKR